MPEDYRPTEPVHDHGFAQLPPDDEVPPPPPPAREQGRSMLLWIAVVVAVFMAVPLLANLSARAPLHAAARAASAPAAAAEAAPVASAPVRPAQAAAPALPAVVQAVPPAVQAGPATMRAGPEQTARPAPALPESERQMVTKCVERGRVVYTQTGECAGSVSALPIDTSKNVVGPARNTPRQ